MFVITKAGGTGRSRGIPSTRTRRESPGNGRVGSKASSGGDLDQHGDHDDHGDHGDHGDRGDHGQHGGDHDQGQHGVCDCQEHGHWSCETR